MINTDNITINKQSSIRIAGSYILYFDPFQIVESVHDADYIFITHNHYDHFDPESIAKVRKSSTILLAPASMKKQVLAEAGIAEEQCRFLASAVMTELDNLPIETVPAYNRLKPFHPKNSGFLGYIVKMDGITYYIAGDTDANAENRQVKCDVALVPIGGTYTMDKKQAADLVGSIMPQVAIPTHYGDIVGSPEDGKDFVDLAEKLGIRAEIKR